MNPTLIVIIMMRVQQIILEKEEDKKMKKLKKTMSLINLYSTIKLFYVFLTRTAHYGDNFKKMFDTYSNLLVGIEPDEGRHFKVGDIKVRMYYNPLFFLINNRCGSVACTTPDSNGDCVIFTERSFHRLSSKTQKFIVCHEVGHIVNKNKGVPIIGELIRLAVSLYNVDSRELEADMYAANLLGVNSAIIALMELRDNLSGLAKIEISRRIEALDQASINRD